MGFTFRSDNLKAENWVTPKEGTITSTAVISSKASILTLIFDVSELSDKYNLEPGKEQSHIRIVYLSSSNLCISVLMFPVFDQWSL